MSHATLPGRPYDPDPDPHQNYPAALAEEENALLRRRRGWKPPQAEGAPAAPPSSPEGRSGRGRPANVVGLALSGGGQRSATFCLGVLQALAKQKLLPKLDYMSGVSGGNYACSFLGGWISREPDGVHKVQDELAKIHSREVNFLRENGRFLAPNGAGDAWAAAVTHVRNWLAMLVVIGTLMLGLFMLGECVKLCFEEQPTVTLPRVPVPIVMSPFFPAAGAIFLLGSLPLGIAYWLVYPVRGERPRAFFLPLLGLIWLSFGVLLNAGLPGFILDQPWPWFAVLLLTVEWCVWAQYRQAMRDPGAPVSRVTRCTFLFTCVWLLYLTAIVSLHVWQPGPRWLPACIETAPWAWVALFVVVVAVRVVVMVARDIHLPTEGKIWSSAAVRFAVQVFQDAGRIEESDFGAARSRLTGLFAGATGASVVVLVLAVVDSIGQTLADHGINLSEWGPYVTPAALLSLLHSQLPKFLADDENEGKPSSAWVTVVLWLAAGVVALVIAAFLAFVAREFSQHLSDPWLVVGATVGVLVLAAALGNRLEFVNLSSHHQLYMARLTRAYLGASNPVRRAERNWRITETVTNDQIEFRDYRPHEKGGPLHLINVTMNETISGVSNIQQRDRKGLSFAVGPAGISVSRNHHALFRRDARTAPRTAVVEAVDEAPRPDDRASGDEAKRRFHAFGSRAPKASPKDATNPAFAGRASVTTIEMPAVGAWMGISGAAFTTGLGSRTSLATSLLLGLFNVRLGYWWNSGVNPHRRHGVARMSVSKRLGLRLGEFFPAQVAFGDEVLARFHGFGRKHWYLSDGGHFENTACYELIRRRVPFIICCDCGCDPDSTFEDLANLVRKARLDFETELNFLDEAALSEFPGRGVIGPLSALRARADDAEGRKLATSHAALARIIYPEPCEPGWLLLIKPTLRAGISRDVLHYAVENPTFPQQTTMDQFFDEAQWESYRRLGWEIGNAIFGQAEMKRVDEHGHWVPDFSALEGRNERPSEAADDDVLAGLEKLINERFAPGAAVTPKDLLPLLGGFIRDRHRERKQP